MAARPARKPSRPSGPNFERRLLLDAGIALLPLLALSIWLLWQRAQTPTALWVALGIALALSALGLARLRRRAVFPLYTVSNLLEALREGDYSLRGSRARRGDPIGDVVWEVNALSHTLREQRLKVEETSALLGKVIASIDIALLGFDGERRLQLLNPAGERLLARRARDALGRGASELGLDQVLDQRAPALLDRAFAGGAGRYELRRFSFRQDGLPLELLAISDLSRTLREEEQLAWQRLVRVLSHELNNTLAPIRSMAGTVSALLAQSHPASDWREDAKEGLRVIAERSEALGRFVTGYAQLARLPPPRKQPLDLAPLLHRLVMLEQRLLVELDLAEPLALDVDPDQLEQALINLLNNAVEASLPERGGVALKASQPAPGKVLIEVSDEGLGLAATDNLFVPFFTTKPGGSGIGLVLARQIAEAHGGTLGLRNRTDRRGCIATLQLPLSALATPRAG